ncbi:unnamed protein product [Mytilus edulis]|uniref:Uncharacterized protein n=1 Tax=Mytilus edulis TaxID=6550 RepID=A0A8S3SVN9_MYTED|nr:unnamed protein product [Mytilus edulis]
MERISTDNSKCESLKFYTYLCQNIGSDELAKIRRLAFTILDLGQSFGHKTITSGSKGEGLDMKGSDLDVMSINPFFKVYESEKDVVLDGLTIPLVMVTDATQPCFTQLCRLNHHRVYNGWDLTFKLLPLWQKHPLGYMLSSEQYKLFIMSLAGLKLAERKLPRLVKTHGPCLTSFDDQLDNKYTDEKIFTGSGLTKYELTFIQKHVLNLMKTEKLYSVLRSLRIETLTFGPKSSIIPQELQLDVTRMRTCYYPLPFAYFLGFLCNYHLQDIPSSRRYLQQLILTKKTIVFMLIYLKANTTIICGVAHQLIGEAYFAKISFQEAAMQDEYNFTSAATRLSSVT